MMKGRRSLGICLSFIKIIQPERKAMQRLKSVRANSQLRIIQPAQQKFERADAADLIHAIENLKERVRTIVLMIEVGEASKSLELESGNDFYRSVRQLEVAMITRALELTGGSQVKAAKLLKIKVTTLNSKIKRYKI
jgi:DNA-binding NtrC family response regulator